MAAARLLCGVVTLLGTFDSTFVLAETLPYYVVEGMPEVLRYHPVYSNLDIPAGPHASRVLVDVNVTRAVGSRAGTLGYHDLRVLYVVFGARTDVLGMLSRNGRAPQFGEMDLTITQYDESGEEIPSTSRTGTERERSLWGSNSDSSLQHNRGENGEDALKSLRSAAISMRSGETRRVRIAYPVASTDLYTVLFLACDNPEGMPRCDLFGKSLTAELGQLSVSGEVVYQNPFGLLPAHKVSYIPLFTCASIVFGVGFVAWMTAMFRNRKNLLGYHSDIAAILALATAEAVFNLLALRAQNNTGSESVTLILSAETMGAVKDIVCVITLICACSGVELTNPALGRKKSAVLYALSLLYFALRVWFAVNVSAREMQAPDDIRTLTNFVLGSQMAFSAIVFVWAFVALAVTLRSLPDDDAAKRSLFRMTAVLLALACIAAVAMAVYRTAFVKVEDWMTTRGWQTYWLVHEGFWMIHFLSVLAAFMWLWRPSKAWTAVKYPLLPLDNEDQQELLCSNELADNCAAAKKANKNTEAEASEDYQFFEDGPTAVLSDPAQPVASEQIAKQAIHLDVPAGNYRALEDPPTEA